MEIVMNESKTVIFHIFDMKSLANGGKGNSKGSVIYDYSKNKDFQKELLKYFKREKEILAEEIFEEKERKRKEYEVQQIMMEL